MSNCLVVSHQKNWDLVGQDIKKFTDAGPAATNLWLQDSGLTSGFCEKDFDGSPKITRQPEGNEQIRNMAVFYSNDLLPGSTGKSGKIGLRNIHFFTKTPQTSVAFVR